ncbi:hypothetical protein [Nocardia sp. NPDC057227]|uniref:hypothetical protein n=1 Tax=Nocardia sp. NPDC057227 TaxID=3346056 RepID=UPI00362E4A72
MTSTGTIEGPGWCSPGLDTKGSRFPLRVEAPVMNLVDALVPGVSTMTSNSRYYGLYWALADYAHARDLDTPTCRTLLRRAEYSLALASLFDPATGALSGPGTVHGAETVRARRSTMPVEQIVAEGSRSYSPRAWGFWSQYKGPSVILGIAATEREALRRGPRTSPPAARAMFADLFEVNSERPISADEAVHFAALTRTEPDAADIEPLRDIMTAPRVENRATWTANDHTRRSTYRLLARAVQLQPGTGTWTRHFVDAVAYGSALETDPVLVSEGVRARAWRGLLLRHHSVGAWRRFWATLVDHVWQAGEPVSRAQLHEWIRGQVTDGSVTSFLNDCPAPFDAVGHPAPAEATVRALRSAIEADLAILLLGSIRDDRLTGTTQHAFRGRSSRSRFLDPAWVAHQRREFAERSLSDFACRLVDDMLAQAHRVALLKMQIDGNNRMKLPTKLHERNGRYFANGREGAGNVGLRIDQLGEIGRQLGLFEVAGKSATVTDRAVTLLELA